ncbi:MAG: AsmA family protein [Gammaproteobacteria bacterium]
MAKFVKFLGIAVGIIVLLLVVAIVVIPMVIDPNDFKGQIAGQVKKATGRDLTIEGDIGLSVFPWVGLELGKTRLGEAPEFGSGDFAVVEAVEVRARLMPLLESRLEMDTVRLEGLAVSLRRNKDGRANWDDLAKGSGEAPEEEKAAGSKLAGFAIGGLEVVNASATWQDEAAGQDVRVSGLDLTTGALSPGEPVDVRLRADVVSAAPSAKANIDFKGTVDLVGAGERLHLNGTTLALSASSESFDIESSKLDVSGDITLDLVNQLLTIPAARVGLKAVSANAAKAGFKEADITLNGDVRYELASGQFDAPGVKLKVNALNADGGSTWKQVGLNLEADLSAQTQNGSFKTRGMTLNLDAKGDPASFEDARVTVKGDVSLDGEKQMLTAPALDLVAEVVGKSLPGGRVDANLKADTAVDLKGHTAQAKGMVLKALGLDITGNLAVAGLDAQPVASGDIAVARFNPRTLLQRLGQEVPVTTDRTALNALTLATRFEASAKGAKLSDLNARLDQSTLKGLIDLKSFDGPVAVVRLDLDAISIDRYLPPEAEGAADQSAGARAGGAQSGAAKGAKGPTPIELPVEQLRALDLDGQFTIGKLKAMNLWADKVRLTVVSKGGVVDIKPLNAQLYGGSVNLVNRLDVRGDIPVVTADTTMKNFQVEPFLTDLQGESQIRGTTDFAAKVTAKGKTDKAMIAASNGTARFEFRNGAIKGFNLAQSIRKAKAAIKGEKLPEGEVVKETDFTKLSGTARIVNGVVDNQDLNAMLPLLRVTGRGTANLNDNTADYTVGAKVVATSKGQGGKELAELNGVTIPVKIKGPFEDPDIKPDLAGVLKSLATKKVTEKVKSKVQEKVQEKLQEQVGDKLLKGLLGR